MRSVFITRPEGRLRVVVAGESGPPVLLLSGAGLDNALLSWKRMIPALGPRHRVLALDWPKQGESRPWRGRADHRCLMDCVTAVLDHFGLERAALVGLSQGGAIALAWALARPERVTRLVAIAPGGIIRFPPGVHQLLWLTAKLSWLTAAAFTPLARSRRTAAALARAIFPTVPPDFDEIVDDMMREARMHGAGASDWQNASIGFLRMKIDLTDELHRIACPTLFIQGDRDPAVKPAFTAEAARRVPGARLEMLEGQGHWPNRQSPEAVNALVGAFLAGEEQSGHRRPVTTVRTTGAAHSARRG